MAKVTVEPEVYEIVDFAPAAIAAAVEKVAAQVGLDADTEVRVIVDEHSMLSRAELVGTDPIVIAAHSGAFEDRSRPRQLSEANLVDELGRLLQRAVDRLQPAFAGAPPEAELSAPEMAAWDVYCLGRNARWQTTSFRDRHRYDFRLKCGFGPDADAAFDRLWNAEGLGWADVAALAPEPPSRPTKPPSAPARRRQS